MDRAETLLFSLIVLCLGTLLGVMIESIKSDNREVEFTKAEIYKAEQACKTLGLEAVSYTTATIQCQSGVSIDRGYKD